jgi:hypothetical protein
METAHDAWGQTLSSWFSLQRAGGAASIGPLPVRRVGGLFCRNDPGAADPRV